jgi:hypothetical protein
VLRAYLARWKRREKPQDHVTDYWFAFTPDKAAVWQTRQDAQNDCTAIFNQFGIDILSTNESTYLCRNFVVEERGPGEFVVCCDGPFLVQNASGQSGSETQNKSS